MTDENEPKYENVEDGQVVEDARTGELIPRGTPQTIPGILAQIELSKVGMLELSPETEKVLDEELNPEDVKIRPDGLLYLPWTWYNQRLNRAFGRLKWALIPQGSPRFKEMGNKTLVVWLHWLVVKGTPVSMAGGETAYQPSNFTMSEGDAIEGARSNSLARNCKNLGMAIQLWDLDWCNRWKKQYAEYGDWDGKGKKTWRKKVAKMPTAQPEAVKAAVEEGGVVVAQTEEPVQETGEIKKIALSELRTVPMVNKMAGAFGVEKSVVVKALGKLEAGHSYSFDEVKNKIEEK